MTPAALLLLLALQAPTPPAAAPWRPLPSPVADEEDESAVAIKVKRAFPVSGDPIDDATILLKGSKIVTIGKIVDVPKGARHLDYSELTAMPGLVVAFSRAGYAPRPPLQGAATKARDGIDPDADLLRRALAAGITSMAIVPTGTGITGQASVIRTRGKTIDEMVLRDDAYVFATFEMNSASKDAIRQAFEKAKEEMEKFEKPASAPAAPLPPPTVAPPASAPASAPASVPASRPTTAPAAPPKPNPQLEPLIRVLKKERKLFVSFGGFSGPSSPAAEVLHLNDALKNFDIERVFAGGPNLALVTDRVAEVKAAAALNSEEVAMQPYTRIRMNAAQELSKAGLKVCLLPPSANETRDSYENWLFKVGEIVKNGMPAADAMRAVTLTPAEILGLGDRIGALAPGHDADILFFDGHPFDASSKLVHVMAAGEIIPKEEM